MNAVVHMAQQLPPEAVRRLAALRVQRFESGAPSLLGGPRTATPIARHHVLDTDEARARVIARWGPDLCGLLNALSRGELGALAQALGIAASRTTGRSAELRELLWETGAALERGGALVTPAVQPRPIVLGGHLVLQAPPRGMYPETETWPRALPPGRPGAPPEDEPDSIDELLAAADRAIGVRLGRRGRDKGAWGLRAAALLGLTERGHHEPDWRGDVEVKTVPVALDAGGWWRIVEDPAIAMVGEAVLAKLQRTLWLARADVGDGDATIVSWYLLECDHEISRLVRRYLHERPKGPAGTDARGLYLQKRFFADAGMLATLNGPAPGHERLP